MGYLLINEQRGRELATEIRACGYSDYGDDAKFVFYNTENLPNLITFKDAVHYIGQLNLSNSIDEDRLALESIPVRSFVTEKSLINDQPEVEISASGAYLIRNIKIAPNKVLVGWLEYPTRKFYLRLIVRNEEENWEAKAAMQILGDNITGIDIVQLSPTVVIAAYTSETAQGFQRIDINEGSLRKHGEISPSVAQGFLHIRVWRRAENEFAYILWGLDNMEDGGYGATVGDSVILTPYDSDPNGNTQSMEFGQRRLKSGDGSNRDYLSYTNRNTPHALCAQQISPTSLVIFRICKNSNVVTTVCEYVNGGYWERLNKSTQSGQNGASIITGLVATSTKAIICYNGQGKIWAAIASINSTRREAAQSLLDGDFSKICLVGLGHDTYLLFAYGDDAASDSSCLIKFKVNFENNTFDIIFRSNQQGYGMGEPVLLDNLNIVVCANKYNTETQTNKVMFKPIQLNMGIVLAKHGDPILGVTTKPVVQGEYVPVAMVKVEE